MRNKDLFGVSILLSIAIVYITRYLFPLLGIRMGFVATLSSPLLASFVIAPILLILLTPLNHWFLKWRKERGRDILEEEKYETEHGMIKLTPNANVPKEDDK